MLSVGKLSQLAQLNETEGSVDNGILDCKHPSSFSAVVPSLNKLLQYSTMVSIS